MRFSYILPNECNVNVPSPPPLLSLAPPPTHTFATDSPKNKMKSSSSLSSFLPRKFSRSELSYFQEASEFCVCVCARAHTHTLTQTSMQTWACACTSFQYDETVLSERQWGYRLWVSWVKAESAQSQVSSFIHCEGGQK